MHDSAWNCPVSPLSKPLIILIYNMYNVYICTLYIYIQIYWDASKIDISLVQVRIRGPGREWEGSRLFPPMRIEQN